jgi:hypothetical protein
MAIRASAQERWLPLRYAVQVDFAKRSFLL